MLNPFKEAMIPFTPALQLTYAEARPLIKSGDIISFFAPHNDSFIHRVVTKVILYFCGSPIYHSGTAIWMTTGQGDYRLMLMEGVGVGRRLVNLSTFSDHKMEVHHIPSIVDVALVEDYLLNDIGKPYSFWDLFVIGVREFCGIKAKPSATSQVCSETAACAWQTGGFHFDTTVLSPGKLRTVLCESGVPPAMVINVDA